MFSVEKAELLLLFLFCCLDVLVLVGLARYLSRRETLTLCCPYTREQTAAFESKKQKRVVLIFLLASLCMARSLLSSLLSVIAIGELPPRCLSSKRLFLLCLFLLFLCLFLCRDLVEIAMKNQRSRLQDVMRPTAVHRAEQKILEALLGNLSVSYYCYEGEAPLLLLLLSSLQFLFLSSSSSC